MSNTRQSVKISPTRWLIVIGSVVILMVCLLTIGWSRGIFSRVYTSTTSIHISSRPVRTTVTLPHPDHVVIVIEENHSYADIIGSPNAPYINSLAQQGASFAHSYGVTHPSQPNYLALFSGSTQGLTSDDCPQMFSGPNLGSVLLQARYSFAGYSEGMPSSGYTGCYAPDSSSAKYARKHNPWVNFTNVPSSSNLTLNSFPTDYNALPTVSFVIPDQYNDMHSASVRQGDSWLKDHLSGYVRWAQSHNSLLIVTWDEDDGSATNQIPTLFVGPMVKAGQYSEQIDHYNTLRTIEDMFGLSPLKQSADVNPIVDIWRQG